MYGDTVGWVGSITCTDGKIVSTAGNRMMPPGTEEKCRRIMEDTRGKVDQSPINPLDW